MDKRYLTPEDVKLRLDECIIKVDEDFYFVRADGMKIKMFNINSINLNPVGVIDANSDRIDLTSINPGYVNHNDYAVYVTRAPYRKQKQGIGLHNLIYLVETNMDKVPPNLLFSTEMVQALYNKYPSYKEALKKVRSTSPGMVKRYAFTKSFMLCRDLTSSQADLNLITLWYESEPIGTVDENNVVTLNPLMYNSVFIYALTGLGIEVA